MIHTCERCEVEHRDVVPVCWLCGGSMTSTQSQADEGKTKVWEIAAMKTQGLSVAVEGGI